MNCKVFKWSEFSVRYMSNLKLKLEKNKFKLKKLTVNLPNVNPNTNIPIIEAFPYLKLVLKHRNINVPKSRLIINS